MRCSDRSRSVMIVLCLLGCNVWKAVSKTLQKDTDAKEVTLRVHLSDSSTHQPLPGVTVEVFANHTSVATETSLGDGNVFLRFSYRLGDLLVVTATKRGYVPNSAPWRPTRLPVFSSLSLDLLPERAATLMVYEDVVQIVSGYQGSRLQPWVQFQRRALSLPPNASYTNLTALLTVTHSPHDAHRLSYLQALNANTTGGFELTPVAAISVHLLGSDGAELQVNEPISVSVPLPANSGLKENDHIPAWRFDPKLGAWLKSSLGYVQREGDELILTYIASQLGYWVAAMSPLNTGPVVAKDISTYHTVFLLAILGGMALILLLLLCLLLYYCRRKCAHSRPSHRKLVLSSALDSSKRDQSTSMSHVNLISETQLDTLDLTSPGPEADLHTPMLKPVAYVASSSSADELTTVSRDDEDEDNDLPSGRGSSRANGRHFRRSAETLELKACRSAAPSEADYRRSCSSMLSSSSRLPPLFRSSASSSTSSPHPLLPPKSSEDRVGIGGHRRDDEPRLSPLRDTPRRTPGPASSPCLDGVLERRVGGDLLLSRSVDQLERGPLPLSLALPPRPGALLCCSSELAVSEAQRGALAGGPYVRPRPTLVIPAHYMRLPGTHPLSGQAFLLQSDERSELETIQAELAASHQPLGPAAGEEGAEGGAAVNDGEVDRGGGGDRHGGGGEGQWSQALSIPDRLSQAGLGLVQMNGEDTLLAEKALMELRGGKPLPHPRAWFVSLDGRSNAHIRHSYIDLHGAGRGPAPAGRRNDASLDSGVDMGEVRGPGWRRAAAVATEGRTTPRDTPQSPAATARDTPQSPPTTAAAPLPPPQPAPSVTYTQLVFLEDSNGNASQGGTPVLSPQSEGNGVREEEEEEERRHVEEGGDTGSSTSPSPPSPLPPPLHSPPPLPEPMEEEEEEEEEGFRTEPAQTRLQAPPPGELVVPDDSGEDDNKKSPWQKREERPLLAFQ
ncbi:protein FAM171A1 [Alosa pseudoharengus]|uniref:protein FAM171A1 n=1 Tax=Alosa pseudoharengus TaxID=34774 RepID=UPI003F88FD83